MNPTQKFWYEILREGILRPYEKEWESSVTTESLYADFTDFSKKLGGRWHSSPSNFGKELKKVCPKVVRKKGKADPPFPGERTWCYVFPGLDECRKLFEAAVKMEIDWS